MQTSINTQLSRYTQSTLFASAISFSTGVLWLIGMNLILNPGHFSISAFKHYRFDYYWYIGGLMGVVFLTGNILLLSRIGASLTVVSSITGQVLMSVLIDTYGWFHVHVQTLSMMKVLGILLLLIGIVFMNLKRKSSLTPQSQHHFLWIAFAVVIGFAPPIQTAVNSHLGQTLNSPYFSSLISFTVGAIALTLLTAFVHKRFTIKSTVPSHGSLKWWHFIGGALGGIFVTTNIILTPHIGVTLTLITVMLGQMIAGAFIDHLGLLGLPSRSITKPRLLGLSLIIIAIAIIQFN
ncbi:DMT family transporter [Staphylococcus lutrae]|uniref:DMT family transporter n=1 Tax=Staphylococcus lutrae TaxID=155085 RepID=UPI001FD2150A|nr:DMT family transporter [Staphylococcus lutrae]